MLDSEEKYTDGFLLWCRKTKQLTDEQWAHGFKIIETEMAEAERMGEAKDLWPPAYPAFIEKCKSIKSKKMYQFTDDLRVEYDPVTGRNRYVSNRLIEDQDAKEARCEEGIANCDELLASLNA